MDLWGVRECCQQHECEEGGARAQQTSTNRTPCRNTHTSKQKELKARRDTATGRRFTCVHVHVHASMHA